MRKVLTLAEWTAGLSVLAAVAIVPLILSDNTPYALDIKRPVAGACSLIAGLALLLIWLEGGTLSPKISRITQILLCFVLAMVISSACSAYRGAAFREAWWHAAHVILFLATAIIFRDRKWFRVLLFVLLVVAGIVALSGIMQHFGTDMFGKSWRKSDWQIELGQKARVLGTLALETALGGYMATCSILALGVVFWLRRWWLRVVVGILALMMASCMMFSGTRSAMAAFGLGLLTLGTLWFINRMRSFLNKKTLIVAVLAAVAIGVLLPFAPWDRIKNTSRDLSIRTTIWKAAIGMFCKSPIAGMGPGTFGIYYADFRPADYAEHNVGAVTSWAHSEYMDLLAESGILGVVPFVALIGLIGFWGVRSLRNKECQDRHALLIAALAAAATMLFHAGFNVDTRYPTCRMTMWIMLGLCSALFPGTPSPARPRRIPLKGLLVILILGIVAAVAVWHYLIYQPHLARVELRSATNAIRAERMEAAVVHARRATRLDPQSVQSHYELGIALFGVRRYQEALTAFEELKTHSPHFADVDFEVGIAHALIRQPKEAREAFAEAERLKVSSLPPGAREKMTDFQLQEWARRWVQIRPSSH